MGLIVWDFLFCVGLTCFCLEIILEKSFISLKWSVEGHWQGINFILNKGLGIRNKGLILQLKPNELKQLFTFA